MKHPEYLQEHTEALQKGPESLCRDLLTDKPNSDQYRRYDGDGLSLDFRLAARELGIKTARELSNHGLETITNTLKDPRVTEERLTNMNSIHYRDHSENYPNVVISTATGAIEALGVYPLTLGLVAEVSRHTGLPVGPLCDAAVDYYFSETEYPKDDIYGENKLAAVQLMTVIGHEQAALPDSAEKVQRIASVAVMTTSLIEAEAVSGNKWEERHIKLLELLRHMGNSISDPELKTQLIEQLKNEIEWRDARERLEARTFAIEMVNGETMEW